MRTLLSVGLLIFFPYNLGSESSLAPGVPELRRATVGGLSGLQDGRGSTGVCQESRKTEAGGSSVPTGPGGGGRKLEHGGDTLSGS